MKNILLIEDNSNKMEMIKLELRELGYEPVCARNVEEAFASFPAKQWDAIAIDGCLDGHNFNCQPLIKKFVAECKKGCILLAMSSATELSEEMVGLGCTHMVRKKEHAAGKIHKLLKE